jgi:RHS repeat-associated protein
MVHLDAAGNLMADGTGVGTHSYQWDAEGRRVAWKDGSGNVYYYFEEPAGRTRTITGANGVACNEADYYLFGGEQTHGNTCDQNYRFAGMYRDGETGNDYTQFRMYESNLGRWMTPDLLGGDVMNPQSLNRYTYVLNNPLNYIDPLGSNPHTPEDAMTVDPLDAIFGDTGVCYSDGTPAPCGMVLASVVAGAACIGSCSTPVVASNGLTYNLVQTAGPTVYAGGAALAVYCVNSGRAGSRRRSATSPSGAVPPQRAVTIAGSVDLVCNFAAFQVVIGRRGAICSCHVVLAAAGGFRRYFFVTCNRLRTRAACVWPRRAFWLPRSVLL